MSVYKGSSQSKRKASGGGGGSYHPSNKRFKRDLVTALTGETLTLDSLNVRRNVHVDGNIEASGDIDGANTAHTAGDLPDDADGYLKNTSGVLSWTASEIPDEISIDTILIPNGTLGAFQLKADGGSTYMRIDSNGGDAEFTQGISANDITALRIKTLHEDVNLVIGHGTGNGSIVANDAIVGAAVSGTGIEARTDGVTILDAGTTGPTLKAAAGSVAHNLILPANNAIGALTNDGSGNFSYDNSGGAGSDLDLTSITIPSNQNNAFELKNGILGNIMAVDTTTGAVDVTFNDKLIVGGTIVCIDQITSLSTTQSNGSGTGSLLTHGGCGIAKNLNVGGDTNITGDLTSSAATVADLTATGSVTFNDRLVEIGSTNTSNTDDVGIINTYSNDGGSTQLYGGMVQAGTAEANAFHAFKDSVSIPSDVSNTIHAPVAMSNLILTGQDKAYSTTITPHPSASYGVTLPPILSDETVLKHLTNGETVWNTEAVVTEAVTIAGTGGGGIPGAWTFASSPNELVNIKHVVWDEYYAAYYCKVPSTSNGMWKSTDGKTYTSLATPNIGLGSFTVATANDGRQMASHGDVMLFSSDGATYTATGTSPVNTIRDVAYGNGTWVAAGEDASYKSTDNGDTWSSLGTYDGIGTKCVFAQFLNNGAGGFLIGCTAGGTSKLMISSAGTLSEIITSTDPAMAVGDAITGITVSEELEIIVVGTSNVTNVALYVQNTGIGTYSYQPCTVSTVPATGIIHGGAYGNGKFVLSTGGEDTEYYESTDGKVLTQKTDMTTESEVTGAYSPTLDMFVFGYNGGTAQNQMIYREENGTPATTIDMAVINNDYLTFSQNTNARIRSFEDDIIYENDRYHTFAVNGAPKFVVADTVVQMTEPLLHGYMTTAARDALSVSEGTSIWNTTTKHLNIFDGTNWTVNNTYSEAGSWEDLVQYMGAGEKKASNPPAELQIGEFTLLEFDEKDQVTMHYHILHDYKLGSDAFVHVHWSPLRDAVPGDIGTTVVWTINYTIARGHHQGGVNNWNAPTVLTLTHTFDGTELENEHMITESVTGFDLLEADSILTISVKYDQTSTWGESIVGLSCDLHYESTQETTTLRVPPFN